MLGNSVGGGDDWKGVRFAVLIKFGGPPDLSAGIRLRLGERVLYRALHRLVVLGKWPVHEIRRVELANSRCQHDKGIGLARWHATVGDIAFPCFLLGIPADDPLARVERLAFAVDRSTIV